MARAIRHSKEPASAAPDRALRAFPIFDHVPPGCQLQIVRDDRHAPHLRVGEWCVVDAGGREPDLYELFAVRQSGGVRLWQIAPDQLRNGDPADDRRETFMLMPLDGIRGATEADRSADAARRLAGGRFHLCDGPIFGWALRERIVGRVIGIFEGTDSRILDHQPIEVGR